MARTLDLRDILKLVKNGFGENPFAQSLSAMLIKRFCISWEILPELLKARTRDVASIAKQFSKESFGQDRNRDSVIDIPWCPLTSQQLALVIDDQAQFEAIELSIEFLPRAPIPSNNVA